MIMAAAKKLAELSPAVGDANAPLLPPVGDSRKVGLAVAEAVGRAAIAEGVAGLEAGADLVAELRGYVWEPVYRRYEVVKDRC
jgi:malate dehydrogenase (oxaloacetate-decarboxylating)